MQNISQRTCLHCGAPYKARRATKKYCSDNCKQLAYFKRNGMVFSVNDTKPALNGSVKPAVKEVTVNSQDIINVKQDDTVKTPSETVNVKQEGNRLTGENQKQFTLLSEEDLEKVIERITESLDVKVEKAILSVKQEFDVKYAELYANFYDREILSKNTQTEKEKVLLCNPAPFTGFTKQTGDPAEKSNPEIIAKDKSAKDENQMLTQNAENTIEESKEHFTVKDQEYQSKEILQYINFPDDEEEETDDEPEEETTENDNEVYNNTENVKDDSEITNVKDATENASEQATVKGNYIKELEVKLAELTFKAERGLKEQERADNLPITTEPDKQKPEAEQKYEWVQSRFIQNVWNDYENNERGLQNSIDPNVEWLNLRLRPIIENVIRLNEYAFIDRATINQLSEALKKIIASHSFTDLLSDYPYSNTVKELSERINMIALTAKGDKIPLRISFNLKARLVSMREQFKEGVDLIKFSELDFSEPHRTEWIDNRIQNRLSGIDTKQNRSNSFWDRHNQYVEAGLIDGDLLDNENEDEEKEIDYRNLKLKENPYNARVRHLHKYGKFPERAA